LTPVNLKFTLDNLLIIILYISGVKFSHGEIKLSEDDDDEEFDDEDSDEDWEDDDDEK
jgi:hypothetical protein